jgi:hypothetical protein
MHYLESIFKVLIVGLILGAGLPALFATGMLAYSFGSGGEEADHQIHKSNPPLKYVGILLFLFVARATIIHHFGVDLFPMLPKK